AVDILQAHSGLVDAGPIDHANGNSLESGVLTNQVRREPGFCRLLDSLQELVPYRARKAINIGVDVACAGCIKHAIDRVLRIRGEAVGYYPLAEWRRDAPLMCP